MVKLSIIRERALYFIFAIVFIFGLISPVSADYNAGLSAYKKGDYETASKEWLPLAEEGNAKAQNAIGLMHVKGQGFSQDYTEGFKWYQKAAKGGYPAAMHNLGNMYANGEGLTENFDEAIKWYRMAAEQGHHAAMHRLAEFYIDGKRVTRDYVQGYTWLLIADCKELKEIVERRGIAVRLTKEQIAAAKKKAAEWKANK